MPDYHLRAVRPGDAAAIAGHRARMFHEMRELSDAEVPALEAAVRDQLEPLIASGEYFGWVIEIGAGGEVVSGVGAFLHRLLPRGRELGLRQEAYVLNVYTEPAHRRRGRTSRSGSSSRSTSSSSRSPACCSTASWRRIGPTRRS